MYSQELQDLTTKMLKELPMAMMKHKDAKYGVLILEDNIYVISDRDNNAKYHFYSVEELLLDGWVVD